MCFETGDFVVHSAFGLRFRSRLPWLPAPRADADPADVELSFGPAGPALVPDEFVLPQCEAVPGRLWFRTRTVADFLVEDGCRVRILPKQGVEPLKLANLLFGAISGALLIQRGTLALHGCSIETPTGAVLFCGASGAGKSTLAALLLERGLRLLDDNIAALTPDRNGFMVQPGLGQVRLTADSLGLLGRAADGPGFSAPREVKYPRALGPAECCAEPRRLRHIFLLDRADPTPERALRGPEKLSAIRRHVFVGHMVAPLGQRESHFRAGLGLAGAVPVSRLGQAPGLSPSAWADLVAKRLLDR